VPYNRDVHREYMRTRYATDPEHRRKHKARVAAYRLIRDGKVTKKPCETCGAEKSEMHHDDYDKPKEIRWLCRLCHKAEHGGGFK
jgi:hypothetical protein